MPFLAIAFKNRLDVVDGICSKKSIKGIEGYCNLIKGYQIIDKK